MPETSSVPRPSEPPVRSPARGTGAPVAVPPEKTGSVGVLRDRVEACASVAEALAHNPGADRVAALGVLDTAITRLTSARAALLVAERDHGTWQTSGAPSFAHWRAQSTGTASGAAAREERQAHTLTSLPAVADSANAGDITLAHVEAITRITTNPSEKVRAAATSPQGQAELLALARTQDVPTFNRTAARWAARQDADALEDAHQAQRRRRFLHLATTDQGTRLTGLLDNQAGHRLRLALEAVTPRPAAEDDRSPEQRTVDALTTLAEHTLTDPGTQSGAAVRPHVSFLMREQTWTELRLRRRAQDEPARTSGSGAPVTPRAGFGAPQAAPEPVPMSVPTTVLMEDGTPVPRSEAEQALCDCELTRIVTDAADVPVNLGRTQRLYTGPMRRAVISRDHSCRWPGCHHPARWCEIHHIRWWDRHGGDTSLTNGVLLCPYHHHEVHRRDLTITRLTPPPPSTRPRAQARERRPSGGDGAGDGPGGSQAATGHDTQTEAPAHLDPLGAARYRFTDPAGRPLIEPRRRRPDPARDATRSAAVAIAVAAEGRPPASIASPVTGTPAAAAAPLVVTRTLRATPAAVEADTLWTDETNTPAAAPAPVERAGPPARNQPSPHTERTHRTGTPRRTEPQRGPRTAMAAHETTGPAPP
ncbi:DUF222 domain-containing protein [Cellulomonas hominis]